MVFGSMYPMSLVARRFVELGFIFVYWTLNLSLSSSRYYTVPAPGRHGADHSRSVSVSYFTYRNRIVVMMIHNMYIITIKERWRHLNSAGAPHVETS